MVFTKRLSLLRTAHSVVEVSMCKRSCVRLLIAGLYPSVLRVHSMGILPMAFDYFDPTAQFGGAWGQPIDGAIISVIDGMTEKGFRVLSGCPEHR